MRDLFFHKMHGAGNHFVVLDLLDQPLPSGTDWPRLAQLLCAGHWGAGGDGLLTLEAPDPVAVRDDGTTGAQIRMRMWNPDGTEDMCGNGLRCVVSLAWEKRHVSGRSFGVQTLSGMRDAEVLRDGLIRVGMGEPRYGAGDVPHLIPGGLSRALNYQLPVGGEIITDVCTLSTGSTHTVIFGTGPVSPERFARLSPQIEHHPWFPERTSVLWATSTGANGFRLRIWERGVGETLACGTGACAVAVAAGATGRAGARVAVVSAGGTLEVEHEPGREMVLTGPAVQVYRGRAAWSALAASTPPVAIPLVAPTLPG